MHQRTIVWKPVKLSVFSRCTVFVCRDWTALRLGWPWHNSYTMAVPGTKHFSCIISSQVRYIGNWICHFKMVWWFFGSLGLNKAVTFCSCFRSLQGPLLKVQSAAKLVGGFCVLKTRCPSSSQVNRQVKWAVFVLKMHGEEMSNFRCFGCEKERSLTKKFPGFLHSCQDYLEHIVWLVLWTNTCRLTHCGTMPFGRT